MNIQMSQIISIFFYISQYQHRDLDIAEYHMDMQTTASYHGGL